jgi:hypothetical protein
VRRSLELISSRPAWAKYRAVISKQKVKKKKKKRIAILVIYKVDFMAKKIIRDKGGII